MRVASARLTVDEHFGGLLCAFNRGVSVSGGGCADGKSNPFGVVVLDCLLQCLALILWNGSCFLCCGERRGPGAGEENFLRQVSV